MVSGLRANLPSYGDAGFSLFLRKAFLKAMGYSEDALERPIIGITNTYSDFNPCHGNVPALIEGVKRGVMLAGGAPMVFPTISIHEVFSYPTSMFLRNLMAMDTEEVTKSLPVDAVVLIGGCDKTLPAQVMGAASANRPAIVLPVGSMLTGEHKGRELGACTDCRRLWSSYRAGEIDAEELEAANAELVPTVGTCVVMGTASTMACLMEALGLTLPGAATIPSVHAERIRCAEQSGRRAVALAQEELKPRDILTPAAFRNAMVVMQALGGSTNGIVHLAAIAGRVGMDIDYELFDRLGREVPVLVDLKPSGAHYMPHFHRAGGMPRLMQELAPFLDLDAPTVTGAPLRTIIEGAPQVPGQTIIRTMATAVTPMGAMAMLRGSLAPGGAVIKQSAASPHLMQHEGRALVFEDVEDLAARIDDPDLEVEADDVLVLRNSGPRGAPGMPEAGYLPIPKRLAQQGVKDMVRISDARMSGTAFGTIILHVTPESAVGGPLALVRTGDRIALDVPARRLDLLVAPEELARRQAAWTPPPVPPDERGYAALFRRSVLQADKGCDFDFLTAVRPEADRA